MKKRNDEHDYHAMAHHIINYGCDAGYSQDEIVTNLKELNAKILHLKKNTVIARQGQKAKIMGLVVSGTIVMRIRAANEGICVMRAVRPGEYAGHTLLFPEDATYPCDAVASPECTIIALELDAVHKWRKNPCSQRFFRMIERQLARSVIVAWQHSVIVAPYTLAERVLTYLKVRSAEDGQRVVTLPGTLDWLANYLTCDRTALSRAISRLCREGKIARLGRRQLELLDATDDDVPMKEIVIEPGCTSPVAALRKRHK